MNVYGKFKAIKTGTIVIGAIGPTLIEGKVIRPTKHERNNVWYTRRSKRDAVIY